MNEPANILLVEDERGSRVTLTSLLSLSQKSELVMGMSLGVPSKRHQLGRW